MIEFIGLCVCSACLSCICCLITGGLCLTRAAGRLRSKIVENHLPEDMQWLGNLPPSEYFSESDDSGSSDVYPVPRVCPKDERSNCCCGIPREALNEGCACGALYIGKAKSPPRSGSSGKKETAVKSCDKSRRPRRWTFCFGSGKSSESSGCVPYEKEEEGETGDAVPAERTEPKSCRYKKRKKSRTSGKNGSKTYCACKFKSCSCTNVEDSRKERSKKKYRRSRTPAKRCPADFLTDKRASRKYRKSVKCPINCRCKIIAESEITARRSDRKMEKRCKCGVEH